MAQLRANLSTATYNIRKFKGLNENEDGDAALKDGEASKMLNFRVTDEGALTPRPVLSKISNLVSGAPIQSMWSGYLDGMERLFAAANGNLFEIHISADGSYSTEMIAGLPQSDTVSMFGFDNKLYILTGGLYLAYDGSVISQVEGYIPCVLTACSPDGSGTAYERVNNLTLYRRAQYSAHGTSTQYKVLESNVTVTKVTIDVVETAAYTQLNGTVTFSTAPSAGTNNIEITYKIGDEGTQTIRQGYAANNVGRLVFLFSQVPELDFDIVEVR